ncbi:hypothetical protein AADS67_005083 [Escherichia coli]
MPRIAKTPTGGAALTHNSFGAGGRHQFVTPRSAVAGRGGYPAPAP